MKIIKVMVCSECPYYDSTKRKDWCAMSEREIDTDIPDWCELDER